LASLEAKPHCGLSESHSNGMSGLACRIRASYDLAILQCVLLE
jgi:hypothetical protein